MLLAGLIGDSAPIRRVREQIGRLLDRPPGARLPHVLLEGATGTGKGLLVREMHQAGPRRHGPFVDVNCAAIPETLLEAEMFGFERGAFTDAHQSKPGLVETADGGMLFLDEIGFLSQGLQAKLLKVIEERTVRRLGATRSRSVDVWIIGATSENLDVAMREGRFRPELYHRLAVVTVRLPPLCERGDDITRLAEHFLARACVDYQLPQKRLGDDARAALQRYRWPGNVRELSNVIERAALMAGTSVVSAGDLSLMDLEATVTYRQPAVPRRLGAEDSAAERERLLTALRDAGWNLSAAAARLDMPRNTLRYRMERHGLRPPPPSRQRPARLDAEPPTHPLVDAGRSPSTAVRWERRRVALLRVDLVVGAAGAVDADTSRPLQAIAEKLQSFGGRIEQAALNQLVGAFGLTPVEDAPRRAALAAIAIRKAADRVRPGAPSRAAVKLAIDVTDCLVGQIGGSAVIDADSKQQTCSRLQSLIEIAEPAAVLVSEAAWVFLERRFELTPLPGHARGLGRSYLLGGPERTGFGVNGRVTTFLGREKELVLLESRLDSALQGRGHVVAITGEAGIGKSRVVFEFRQGFAGRPITYLEGRCSAHASAVPYSPVLDLVRQLCGIEETDEAAEVQAKVGALVDRLGMADQGTGPYLLSLLGVDRPQLRDVNPEALKARTLAAIRQTFAAAARLRPCVIVLEDLHWSDTASDELLTVLVDDVPTASVLLVATYRDEYRPAWLARPYVTRMALAPLSREDSRAMLAAALVGTSVPPEIVDLIVQKADGNPLFLEELARTIDEDSGSAGVVSVPDTLHGLLTARIDRLATDARRLLQIGAVIGRHVSCAVLERMVDEAPTILRQHLRHLEAGHFLEQIRATPELEFAFKHALTQEAAYRSLSAQERRPLHAKAAHVLRRLWPDLEEHRPEILARHLTAAELPDEAIPLWLRAGRRAIRRSANVEAVSHLTTALELLRRAPESRERDQRELELQVALGPALVMTKGYAAAEVEHVYQRARALCQRHGDAPQLFRASRGVWLFYLVRGDLRSAQETGEQLLAMATRSGEPLLLTQAHQSVGASMFYRGRFGEARWHLEESVRHCEPALDATRRSDGPDPMVVSLMFLGWTLGMQGEMNEGLRCLDTAIRRADKLAHVFSLAAAVNFAGFLHQLRGDFRASGECADRLIPIARDHCFSHLLGSGVWQRGRALAANGHGDEGLRLMSEGLTMLLASGGLAVTWYLAHAGEAHRLAGNIEQGLAALADAFAAAERNDEKFYLSELHRVRGELLASAPSTRGEAAQCFERAVSIARLQGATLLERRAAALLAAHAQ